MHIRGGTMFPQNMIKDITDFIFINHQADSADIIFIPGSSSPELGESAAKLYTEGYAPYILPSGKYGVSKAQFTGVKNSSSIYKKAYETEFDFLKDVLLLNGVPEKAILKENEAKFTYENALFSKKKLEALELNISKAILCCKSYHARRALMYYQLVFPAVDFMVFSVPYIHENLSITKENWYMSQYGVDKVMGEMRRCGEQFQNLILLNDE